jgi:hypothetical protein
MPSIDVHFWKTMSGVRLDSEGQTSLVGRFEKLSLLSSVVMCADILSVFSFLVVEYQISVLMVPPWRSGQAVRANRPIKT